MKKIYVVHPFQAKKENYQAISNICNRLVAMGYMPLSPVHAFQFMDDRNPNERETALGFCRELIKFADEVWVFGNWEFSEGCRMEVTEASCQLKLIKIVTGWREGYPVFKDFKK